MNYGITIKLKRLNDNIKKKKKNWCLELYTANWTLSCKSSLTCHSKIPAAIFKLLLSYVMCCSSWAIPPISPHELDFNPLLNIILVESGTIPNLCCNFGRWTQNDSLNFFRGNCRLKLPVIILNFLWFYTFNLIYLVTET